MPGDEETKPNGVELHKDEKMQSAVRRLIQKLGGNPDKPKQSTENQNNTESDSS